MTSASTNVAWERVPDRPNDAVYSQQHVSEQNDSLGTSGREDVPDVPAGQDALLAAMEAPSIRVADGPCSFDGTGVANHAEPDLRGKIPTAVMVNLASIMERTDEQLLPSVYKYVACSFNANLAQLGYVTMARAVFQALASPVGGLLGHYFDRVNVIAVGCFIWGIFTFCFSFTNSWQWGSLTWAWNGIGLSFVIPNSQSLVADYYEDVHRGKAFGMLSFTGAIGGMLGTLFATNVAGMTLMDMEGWRWAFRFVAVVAVLIGSFTLLLAKDPLVKKGHHIPPAHNHKFSFSQSGKEFLQVIILQGILGSTPWNALVFMTLYLLLLGFTNFGASLVLTIFLAGAAVGGLIGGWAGDWASRISANHGRIFVCQFSVFVGIPFSLLVIKGLPQSGTDTWPVVALYSFVMFTFGALHTWAGPACNNPIFAEIVPQELRSLVYAFDRSFEGAIAALGAPMVGIIAKGVFHFPVGDSYTCENGKPVDNPDTIDERAQMADALGSAMLVCMIVPWTLCLIIYSGLHWTYADDRRRVEESHLPPAPAEIDRENLLNGALGSHTQPGAMPVVWSEVVK